MFIGHGLVAFALVTLLGHSLGWSRERALRLGALAAVFATAPDIDMLYAPAGLLGGVSGAFEAADAFWQTGNVVHRTVTHSLVVGAIAAVALGLLAAGYRATDATHRLAGTVLGAGLVAGLVAVTVAVTGGLAGIIMALFVLAGAGVAAVATRRGISPRLVGATALVGFCSHPFGDLFTGAPPAMFYPLDVTLFAERVALSADPTFHLLGAFAVELATFWLAAVVLLRLYDRQFREFVHPRAVVGAGYAAAALALPAPTLSASSHFVFTILPVASVGFVQGKALAARSRARLPWVRPRLSDWPTALGTGLTAVTIAAVCYTLVYLFV